MTDKEKIGYLKRYSALMREFDHKWSLLEQLQSRQGKITASYEPRLGTGGGSIYHNFDEDLIIKIVDLRDDALATMDQALDVREELCPVINQLDTDELPYEVCALRYLYGWNWDRIADALELCPAYIHRLHKKALAQLEVVL